MSSAALVTQILLEGAPIHNASGGCADVLHAYCSINGWRDNSCICAQATMGCYRRGKRLLRCDAPPV